MNPDSLERLLREKIETETPRPGFETRLQALAREPILARKRTYGRAFGFGVGFAALVLTVITLSLPQRQPARQVADAAVPQPVASILSDGDGLALFGQAPRQESSVSKEIADLKKDARSAFDFLSETVPSMPVK